MALVLTVLMVVLYLRIILDSLAHTEAQPHIIPDSWPTQAQPRIILVALVLSSVILYLRIIPDSLAHTEAQPRIILVALVLTVPMVVLYLRIIPDSLAHTEAQPHHGAQPGSHGELSEVFGTITGINEEAKTIELMTPNGPKSLMVSDHSHLSVPGEFEGRLFDMDVDHFSASLRVKKYM